MSTNPPAMLLRADLIRKRVLMGSQKVWVLKDPLAREFYYFNEREFAILELLDGNRSLADIAAECATRFAPDFISSESLVTFLADAKQKGLLVAVNGTVPSTKAIDGRRRWWHQPLAIRLPGINPDRLLDVVAPCFAVLLTPLAALMALVMVIAAIVIVMTHFGAFVDHLSVAATRSGFSWLVLLVIVVSLTKIIHELAHALACKKFGGECREIGVMLLVGIPCLYCDVSDAWMLARRWKRICISLAGIAAELVIASIATFVWLYTADGSVRDVCVTVMVVCSITTVLFNGNPLLRYDGYFVLSDLLGIPNLAAESNSVIRQLFRRVIWGTSSTWSAQASPSPIRRNLFLIVYGFASGMYRLLVYGLILSMLYHAARFYELGTPAGCLVLLAVVALLVKWVRPILDPPGTMARRKHSLLRRPALVLTGVCVAIVLGLIVPLPQSIVAPMSVRPANGKTVFVTIPGRLAGSLPAGSVVAAGEVIARLANAEIEGEQLQFESQVSNLSTELEALRGQRTTDRKAAARIPLVSEAIHAAEQRRDVRITEAKRLTLRSPGVGKIFALAARPPLPPDPRESQTWQGTPLSPENRDAWLEEGTVVCEVGDAKLREALILLRQQDISLIRTDQRVVFLMSDHGRGKLTGRVIEVASSPIDEVPEEFTATGLIEPRMHNSARRTYYQVRVSIENGDVSLPIRSTGHVRIQVGHASIANRLLCLFNESFL